MAIFNSYVKLPEGKSHPFLRSPGAADTHRQAIHILRFNQVVHLRKANIQRVAVDRNLWRNGHWFVGQNVGQNMSKHVNHRWSLKPKMMYM